MSKHQAWDSKYIPPKKNNHFAICLDFFDEEFLVVVYRTWYGWRKTPIGKFEPIGLSQ